MSPLRNNTSERSAEGHWNFVALALLLMIAAASLGCRSSSAASASVASRADPSDSISVRIVPSRQASSLRYILEQEGSLKLMQNASVELLSYAADSSMERFSMNVVSSGAPGRSETVTTTVTADLPAGVLERSAWMRLRVRMDGAERMFAVRTVVDTSALKLNASVVKADDGYRFVLRATRQREAPGQYFPSSEQLRITIYNGKGATVWSSNTGLAYLAVVLPVEPEVMFTTHEYTLDWNGTTSAGDRVSPGRYRVVFTLPTRPMPYSQVLDVVFPLD